MRRKPALPSSVFLSSAVCCLALGCSSTGGGGAPRGSVDNENDTTPTQPTDSMGNANSANANEADAPPTTGDDADIGPAAISVKAAAALVTTEAGGTARLTLSLNRAPASDVNVPIASTDTGEATASPASLTFTPDDWNMTQTVTVTGVDDLVDDDDVVLTVTVGPAQSADPDFDGLEAEPVAVTNRDNDTAGVTVLADPGASTSESGDSSTFTIVLRSQPVADTTIAMSTSPPNEVALAPAAVTFTPENWDEPQIVTVTGLDDDAEDGDVTVTVLTEAAVSADPKYDALAVADVTVINLDDDTESFNIEPDDFPAGTVLNSIIEAVTLSTALDDNSIAEFDVTASDDGLDLEPTGERVFGHEGIQFFNSNRRLRLDFTRPAREIRLTFGGGTFFESEVGVLQAFDANGAMLAEYTTAPRGAGESEVMTIVRPGADIAWAVAYSQDSFGRLDDLVITVAVGP